MSRFGLFIQKIHRKNPLLANIFIGVVGIHFALLCSYAVFAGRYSPKKEKRLIVRNLSVLPQEKINTSLAPTPAKTKKIASGVQEVTKKSPPLPAKAKTAPVVKSSKNREKKKNSTAPLQSSTTSAQLIKSLQKAADDLPVQAALPKKEADLVVPSLIASLHIDASSENEGPAPDEITYVHLLAAHLQEKLELPEEGEVKIRLSLKSDGSFLSLQVLKAESVQNLNYLKNTLPALIFPCFNDCSSSERQQIFILCFRSKKIDRK